MLAGTQADGGGKEEGEREVGGTGARKLFRTSTARHGEAAHVTRVQVLLLLPAPVHECVCVCVFLKHGGSMQGEGEARRV